MKMSDFSQLLNQLQSSAAKVQQEKSTRKPPRKRSHNTTTDKEDSGSRNKESKKSKKEQLDINLSFLCIGAQKAGTTWLHEQLKKHPKYILPSTKKELHFWDWNRHLGLEWYCSQFTRPSLSTSKNNNDKRPGKDTQEKHYYGEITPCYCVLKIHHIEEIKELFPDIKIIFIARDLVERSYSSICMELMQEANNLKPGEFLSDCYDDKNGRASEKSRVKKSAGVKKIDWQKYSDDFFLSKCREATHFSRSDYTTFLKNWLHVFNREQILILDYRLISKDPSKFLLSRYCSVRICSLFFDLIIVTIESFLQKICQFINMDEEQCNGSYLDSLINLSERVNAATDKDNKIPQSLEQKMRHFFKPITKEFNQLLKDLGYDWKLDEK